MDHEVKPWSPTVKIPSTVAHAVAILVTIFRLLYRWHIYRFWWEDGWAVLALICDVVCLACVWMQQGPYNASLDINNTGNWLLSLAITCVVWMARMSILCSVVRIGNPTKKLRRIAYGIGIMFLVMATGLIGQKIEICIMNSCKFAKSVAIAQLVTDVISDATLVALPVWFLRGVKLPQDCRVLILTAFSASLLITAVTILHSALLLHDITSVTLVIGHVKAALALLVCDSLVIATFFYRLRQRPGEGIAANTCPGAHSNAVQFTSVIDIPSKLSSIYPVPDER